jgi:hypothetical protein
MSLDKADPEVQVGEKHDFRKRFALISASVLVIMAGACSYYHTHSESETSLVAAGLGLRRLQGRRLPHYTTYGGTSYDVAGQAPGTCCCTERVLDPDPDKHCYADVSRSSYNPTMPPLDEKLSSYNPTMPPLSSYNPTRPPLTGYNPTRPPSGEWNGHTVLSKEKLGCCCRGSTEAFEKQAACMFVMSHPDP